MSNSTRRMADTASERGASLMARRPPFAPGQVWEWVLHAGTPHERRFRWHILEVGVEVKPDPAVAAMWGFAQIMGVRGNLRQRRFKDGVRYRIDTDEIRVGSAKDLRSRSLNAQCIQGAPLEVR